jgi:hypothetical protein
VTFEVLIVVNVKILGCDSMLSGRSPTLKKEVADSSNTLVHIYQTTWHHVPENQNLEAVLQNIQNILLKGQCLSVRGTRLSNGCLVIFPIPFFKRATMAHSAPLQYNTASEYNVNQACWLKWQCFGMYSGSIWVKYQSEHQLSSLRCFMACLSPSRKIPS